MASEFPLPSALPPAFHQIEPQRALDFSSKGVALFPEAIHSSSVLLFFTNQICNYSLLPLGRELRPRRDDAVQRVVEAKYNKLQALGRRPRQDSRRSVCRTNDHERKATSIIGKPSTDT